MRKFFTLVLLLTSYHALADYGIFMYEPIERLKLTQTTPYKETYQLSFKYAVIRSKLNQINNHFCAVGYRWPDNRLSMLVFWDEGEALYKWELDDEPSTDDFESLPDSIFLLYSSIYPKAEILKRPNGIMQGYAQEDVAIIRQDCEKNGENITINAFTLPKNCPPPQEAYYPEPDGGIDPLCYAVSTNLRSRDSLDETKK